MSILENLSQKTAKIFKKKKNSICSVVIVAAGNSSRMGQDKTLMELGGIPVIVRTVKAFDDVESVGEIILVTKQSSIEELADVVNSYKLTKVSKVIAGGANRSESCLAGVSAVNKKSKLIAIHDGARPFVTKELIED